MLWRVIGSAGLLVSARMVKLAVKVDKFSLTMIFCTDIDRTAVARDA